MCDVVIAEDEYLERDVIKQIVGGFNGARIVGEGYCGKLAVELCSVLKPDLIFINRGMGGIDGLEAARLIRRFDKEVVIIMTTAYDKNLPRRKLEELEINELLLKPVRPAIIEEVVARYMNNRHSPAHWVNNSQRKKKNLRFYPSQIMSKEITCALIYIDDNFNGNISLESTAELVSLSSYYFSRLFKKEVGLTFSDFILHKRMSSAKQLLEETDKSILEITLSVGYLQQSYFCKVFKKFTNNTPREYRRLAENLKQERRRVMDKYL